MNVRAHGLGDSVFGRAAPTRESAKFHPGMIVAAVARLRAICRPLIACQLCIACDAHAPVTAPGEPWPSSSLLMSPSAFVVPSAASSKPAPAAPAPGASSAVPSDPLEPFLIAARTHLREPVPEDSPDAPHFYAVRAVALGVYKNEAAESWPVAIVPDVLAQSEDPRAAVALRDWVSDSSAPETQQRYGVAAMGFTRRARYVPILASIARDSIFAGRLGGSGSGGRFRGATQMAVVRETVPGHALGTLAFMAIPEAEEFLERTARDPAASAPNPASMAAYKCVGGRSPRQMELLALSSLRVMAMSYVKDDAPLREALADPSAPRLVRYWAERMLRGPDDEARVIAQRAYEEDTEERGKFGAFTPGFATSPCTAPFEPSDQGCWPHCGPLSAPQASVKP